MKIKKWLSVLPAVCMLLDLAPAIALARHQDRGWEFPDLWEGAEPAAVSEPSRYTVVFRFDETENGSEIDAPVDIEALNEVFRKRADCGRP
ncbi:MAG: hypothetical protein IKH31_08400 [Clostridia bacterium]|nr:hypothetical protein [Clostridia bacterium]